MEHGATLHLVNGKGLTYFPPERPNFGVRNARGNFERRRGSAERQPQTGFEPSESVESAKSSQALAVVPFQDGLIRFALNLFAQVFESVQDFRERDVHSGPDLSPSDTYRVGQQRGTREGPKGQGLQGQVGYRAELLC